MHEQTAAEIAVQQLLAFATNPVLVITFVGSCVGILLFMRFITNIFGQHQEPWWKLW
jgi:hypothetical protein